MRVHLCRHAEAAPGELDAARPLTDAGVEQARDLAHRLAAEGIATLLTSPLLRARQTAEILGAGLGLPVLVDTRLAPGATAAALRETLAGLEGPVAVVGHQPDCSEIVTALTGEAVAFATGASRVVELDDDAG